MVENQKRSAQELARSQREISVAEFFTKNRHLLGFDNPKKALLTAIKEGVDNSLDACEEAGILPEIRIEIKQIKEDRFKIMVEDNGPGIVKAQIPRIFAKLLYGSKFHRLKQSLTADEPIFIKADGKVRIVPIGVFVDSCLNMDEEIKDISSIDVYVPAFDFKSYSYKMRKVSHAIRHKRENEVIRIKTAGNREIKVTGCHSLFALQNGKIEEIEARNIKKGSYIAVPKKLPEIDNIQDVSILDYLNYEDIKSNYIYVYNIKDAVTFIEANSSFVHKKTDKSRRYLRINGVDILEDSFNQYKRKNFLPLQLVYKLNLKEQVKDGYLITYYHGKINKLAVSLPLTDSFIKFLGLFVAEGHKDKQKRQLGLTFNKTEENFVSEIIDFARSFGLNFSIEPRESSIRVKLFNTPFVQFIGNVCGAGAHNKKIPEFIFRGTNYKRQLFIDYYCLGDGSFCKERNALSFSTVSKQLALELRYLFLMQGVSAGSYCKLIKGLGKIPSLSYVIYLNGSDVNNSYIYECKKDFKQRRVYFNSNKQISSCVLYCETKETLLSSDLMLVGVNEVEIINEGYDYVYDLSVPECENFVGGAGGIACHNSRGQQGIGISAAAMYGQLTTGKGIEIVSKISPKDPAHFYELQLDTQKNEPRIIQEGIISWDKEHGTKIEIEMESSYAKGKSSVDEFIRQTALANPHASFYYLTPLGERIDFTRVIDEMLKEPKEIKPHPHGIEIGMLMKMLHATSHGTISTFLQEEFSRVSQAVSHEICEKANVSPRARPATIAKQEIESLYNAIQQVKIIAPPTDCLSPIGAELVEKGMKKELKAEFFTSVSRPPGVYRGRPFIVEVGIAYGGELQKEESISIMRFANRVPLLYQQGACACTSAITTTSWRPYGLQQSSNSVPAGPCVILIHLASVWVPFTSEAKEALAHYPEIIKEIKLALQEAGRELASYVRKKSRVQDEFKKRGYIEKYLPHVGIALRELLALKESEEKKVVEILADTLEKTRQSIELDEEGHEVGEDSVGLEVGKKEDDETEEDE